MPNAAPSTFHAAALAQYQCLFLNVLGEVDSPANGFAPGFYTPGRDHVLHEAVMHHTYTSHPTLLSTNLWQGLAHELYTWTHALAFSGIQGGNLFVPHTGPMSNNKGKVQWNNRGYFFLNTG